MYLVTRQENVVYTPAVSGTAEPGQTQTSHGKARLTPNREPMTDMREPGTR